jgi:FkbM family methyltransferase
MILRDSARRALRALGLEKIHHPSFVDLMIHEGVDLVLDVGANEGHFGRELRERGYEARIVSFEPISEVFRALSRRAENDPLWSVYQLGIGDEEGNLAISVAAEPVFSSFKRPSSYAAEKFAGVVEERRETVPVVRLDQFLDQHPHLFTNSTYLKIDTQGFEQEVLSGAGERLRAFKAVQLELPIRQLYEGQKLLIESIQWMASQGFEVAMAKENGFDWSACRLLELDVVFMRKA